MPPLVQAHILHCEGADPAVDRIVRDTDRVRMIVVFIPDFASAAPTAVRLIEEDGVQLIELDGGRGLKWAAKVVEAVEGRIPVGAVMFGAESAAGAADYGQRYEAAGR